MFRDDSVSRTFQFFAVRIDATKGEAFITDGDHLHLRSVLRLKPGGPVLISDGKGSLYHAVISEIGSEMTRVHLLSPVSWNPESPLVVTLIQAMPKRRKMEWILQKSTELGVTRVVPVFSDYSVPRFSGERERRKQERWNQILREAAKQSYRGIIPELAGITSFERIIKLREASLKILCAPEGEVPLRHCLEGVGKISDILVAIGPEGGFSPSEIALARSRDFIICTLGPRVLRLETAVVKVLSVLQYVLGDG